MNKKNATFFLIIIFLVVLLLTKITLNWRCISSKNIIKTQNNVTTSKYDYKSVKKIKTKPSRIVIYHYYKDMEKIMAKDIYNEKEIKSIINLINSIKYKEQARYKSDIEVWSFLIYIYDENNESTETVLFYNNNNKYAYRDSIAGVIISKDTYDKFLNLYESLNYDEVHYVKIKR